MHEEFHTVDVVAGLVGLMLIAAAILAVTKRFRFPFSVALVVVGVGLGALSKVSDTANLLLGNITLSPDLIFYVFLPTLIFESAFQLDFRQLRHNLNPILTLAVPGLLLSTFLIGGIVGSVTGFSYPVALLLGAILSATDPVAVVALFRRLGVPERLTVLVEGESLFNRLLKTSERSTFSVAEVIHVITLLGCAENSKNKRACFV